MLKRSEQHDLMKLKDKPEEFPNKAVYKILTYLKGAFVFGLEKGLSLIPSSYIVTSEEDLTNSELKRQYRAFIRAEQKWKKIIGINNEEHYNTISRTGRFVKVIKKVYFTIIKHEANYMKLSALILDEYKKERNKT